MLVTSEDISQELEEFGIGEQVQDDELMKLQELCKSWGIDAAKIVGEWMAFSASKKKSLNCESLEVFDREWLQKKINDRLQKNVKTPKEKHPRIYTKETIGSVIEEDIEMLTAYATPEEKTKIQSAAKRQLTPEDLNSCKRLSLGPNRSPQPLAAYSPATRSPHGATPSAKYSTRSNAGEVVSEFGNTADVTWKGEGRGCSVALFDPAAELVPKTKYMFQKMSEKAIILNDQIQEMGTILQNEHGIEEYSHLALPSQDTVTVCGRVFCDAVGRLNKQSVMLEGSREWSGGKCIPLDLSELKSYSLFPGQIIACDGVNITGKKFAVNKIYNSVPLPFPENVSDRENAGSTVRLAVGVGPYAPSGSLDYSPLSDLFKYVARDRPDLLILMGPFVDVKNSLVSGGEVEESYEEIFTKQMLEIGRATQNLGCSVVIVPSSREAHHCSCVYPQPPYSIRPHHPDGSRRLHSELEAMKHVRFVSDPCTLAVGALVVGLTSTDSLMHLTRSEISLGVPGDRMARLCQHILHQRSYYPLQPPLEDVSLDCELWEAHARLPTNPHLLLLPSDLKAFVKDVEGVCCLNPGRLTTGLAGGSWARVVVDLGKLQTQKPSAAFTAQVLKV